MKIEVGDRVYEVKKPTGKVGALHMALIMEVEIPGSRNEEEWSEDERRRVQRSMANVFVRWSEQVLPKIVDGYEKIPGEDQYVIFLRLLEETKLPEELFRVKA